ncbi:sensor domain-containing diguanylate cyclase [Pseudonocardia phyllosphaerae]|uniref:sensor domain-containing diguanylate cyclase n=1 Tax=Pseudonocardia phyllosphaerae TaxID=3390502 RepID=UPI00397C0F14
MTFRGHARRYRVFRIDEWPVRRQPTATLVLLTAVEVAAGVLVLIGLLRLPPDATTGREVLGAVALAVLGMLQTELATGIERVRRRVAHSSYFDLSSVWTFAAALLLPAGLAGLVVAAIYGHLWWRVWRPAGAALHRHVFTMATVVLAAMAVSVLVPHGVQGIVSVGTIASRIAGCGILLVAMLVYVLVNQVLVAAALATSSSTRVPLRSMMGDWDDHVLELATLCLGALASLAATREPALTLLVLPPLLVLHRAVLIRQLEERANTDAKTGLLTAAAWRSRAHRGMVRSRRQRTTAALLILDVDHFKVVNDTHGHLAGDEVLSAIAGTLLAEVRDADPVGRFGGEEFVVLLVGLPDGPDGRVQAQAAAERIRRTVHTLDVQVDAPEGGLTVGELSVSVGVALQGLDGDGLDELLQVADYALYEAKRAGRNRVRLAGAGPDLPGPRV